MTNIETLKSTIKSGSKEYPIFTGLYPAEGIECISEVPSFTKETKNRELADNIMSTPVEDWQRPLDEERVEDIANLFDNSGEFMPNPVLLSQNFNKDEDIITISQKEAAGGIPTEIFEIKVEETEEDESQPIWILDGQHRINGLTASEQSGNPVPFVLLLNVAGGEYIGADMAKIFAQVTTSAEKLDSLHNEWLTYAFDLDSYSQSNPESGLEKSSLETVAHLCKMPRLANDGPNNPFFDDVGFTPHRAVQPDYGGFKYSCTELKTLIRKFYYDISDYDGTLPPTELAKEIGKSYISLKNVVSTPKESVFFGEGDYEQTIIQDAYIVGVLGFLVENGTPNDWETILRSLEFDTTNWNFRNWVTSLGGRAATTSKDIARSVFSEVFRNQTLPENTSNLADYLRGDRAQIEFEFSHLTEKGYASTRDRMSFTLSAGDRTSTNIGSRRHVTVSDRSTNVGKVEILDRELIRRGRPVQYKELQRKNGYIVLDPEEHTDPLQLHVNFHHYGDNKTSAEIDISWSSEHES